MRRPHSRGRPAGYRKCSRASTPGALRSAPCGHHEAAHESTRDGNRGSEDLHKLPLPSLPDSLDLLEGLGDELDQHFSVSNLQEALDQVQVRRTQNQEMMYHAGERGQQLLCEKVELDRRWQECLALAGARELHVAQSSCTSSPLLLSPPCDGSEANVGPSRSRSVSASAERDGDEVDRRRSSRTSNGTAVGLGCSASNSLAKELQRLRQQNRELENDLEDKEADLAHLLSRCEAKASACIDKDNSRAAGISVELADVASAAEQMAEQQQLELGSVRLKLAEAQRHSATVLTVLERERQAQDQRNSALRQEMREVRQQSAESMKPLRDSVEQLRREADQWRVALGLIEDHITAMEPSGEEDSEARNAVGSTAQAYILRKAAEGHEVGAVGTAPGGSADQLMQAKLSSCLTRTLDNQSRRRRTRQSIHAYRDADVLKRQRGPIGEEAPRLAKSGSFVLYRAEDPKPSLCEVEAPLTLSRARTDGALLARVLECEEGRDCAEVEAPEEQESDALEERHRVHTALAAAAAERPRATWFEGFLKISGEVVDDALSQLSAAMIPMAGASADSDK